MAKLNEAGLGVTNSYGPRPVGGLAGRQKTFGGEEEIIFEIIAGELVDSHFPVALPPFHLVEQIYVEVEEVFAASSTADLTIDGGAGLNTKIPLTTLGVATSAIAGLANVKGGSTSVDIALTVHANTLASAIGKARVLVKYKNL